MSPTDDPVAFWSVLLVLLWLLGFLGGIEGMGHWSWREARFSAVWALVMLPVMVIVGAVLLAAALGLLWVITLPWHLAA